MFTHIVVHYAEISLKGRNRAFFERMLADQLKRRIAGALTRRFGSIVIEPAVRDEAAIARALARMPGIAHFSFAVRADAAIDDMEKKALVLARQHEKKSFRITASRADKSFPLTSQQINERIGEAIRKKTGMRVALDKPELTVFIETSASDAFLYTEKIPGIGGLPAGSSGTLVSLLSGGIDSPVSSFLMMKRGCRLVFVHFHNYDILLDRKIPDLAAALAAYQGKTKMYIVPFKALQERIIEHVDGKYRFLVYRRFMFRIAEKILEKEKAKGFVTGDSIGQVASQTVENLNVIYEAAHHPVFSPLIGMNKEEIVSAAKRIGTFDCSIVPYSDCCTYMTAKHPATKADIETIKRMEAKLDASALVDEAMKSAEIRKIS